MNSSDLIISPKFVFTNSTFYAALNSKGRLVTSIVKNGHKQQCIKKCKGMISSEAAGNSRNPKGEISCNNPQKQYE